MATTAPIMLVPTWLLLIAWVTAAGFTVMGQLTARPRSARPDRRARADRHADRLHGHAARLRRRRLRPGLVNDTERRALALAGRRRHRVRLGRDVGQDLRQPGSRASARPASRGALEGPASDWLDLIHPFDRDRYRASLDAVIEQRRGRLSQDFRLRSSAGASYHWFRLKARPVIGIGRRGHPHRRHPVRRHRRKDGGGAASARRRARQPDEPAQPPALLRPSAKRPSPSPARMTVCGRPSSSSISTSSSRSTKPSAMRRAIRSCLTLSRRLGRLLEPQDTLARVRGDEFAMILLSEREPDRIIAFADMVRRARHDPDHLRGARDLPDRLHRPRPHDPQIAARREEVAAERRDCHGSRQAPGRRSHRGVPADHALRPQRPLHPGERPAPGARAQRDQGSVQADRPPGGPHHRGLRVHAALGSSRVSAGSARKTSCRSPRRPG